MVKEILESVLVRQLKLYLTKKDRIYENLTETELAFEGQNFLKAEYPGFDSSPLEMIEAMTSNFPERSMASQALIYSDKNLCQDEDPPELPDPEDSDSNFVPKFSIGSTKYYKEGTVHRGKRYVVRVGKNP